MNWGIRGCVLAAGAAALLSTQAVYAAPPASTSVGVDPLVSLSALSAPQPVVPLLATTAAVQNNDVPPPPKAFSPLLVVLGLVVFIGLMAALISGGGHAHGDLTPVSPA